MHVWGTVHVVMPQRSNMGEKHCIWKCNCISLTLAGAEPDYLSWWYLSYRPASEIILTINYQLRYQFREYLTSLEFYYGSLMAQNTPRKDSALRNVLCQIMKVVENWGQRGMSSCIFRNCPCKITGTLQRNCSTNWEALRQADLRGKWRPDNFFRSSWLLDVNVFAMWMNRPKGNLAVLAAQIQLKTLIIIF